MKKCYVTIHVWLHDMDHNIDLNYRRKIRPLYWKILKHVEKHSISNCHSCFEIFLNISFSVCLHIFICLLYKYLLWSCCFHGKNIALPARFCHEKRHTTPLTEEENGCILARNMGPKYVLNRNFWTPEI